MTALQKNETPLAGGAVANQTTLETAPIIALTTVKSEPRLDSRLLAVSLHKAHHDLFELVKNHLTAFEELGVVRFQTDKPTGPAGGRPERYALLNEDQAYFLLTLTRNTARTVDLKVKLVKAFGEARRAAESGTEYLPTYHALHDELHALAAGSANECFVHMNVNKLVNRTAGIGSGQRSTLSGAPKAMLIVAQDVAAKAMRGAVDHHDGYERAKKAMLALSSLTMLEVPHA
jgi:phage regulator Rha-like protein